MTVRILVNKLDNCFVVHLLEPAIKRCFTGDLCSLKEVSQMKESIFASKYSVRRVLLEDLRENVNIICGDVNGTYVITICPSFMGSSSELINSFSSNVECN